MGTRSKHRHSRGTTRGLASFVSFVVLFALALGQGSSLIALADDAERSTALPSAQPTATRLQPPTDAVVTLKRPRRMAGMRRRLGPRPRVSQRKTASCRPHRCARCSPGGPGSTAETSTSTSSPPVPSPTTTTRESAAPTSDTTTARSARTPVSWSRWRAATSNAVTSWCSSRRSSSKRRDRAEAPSRLDLRLRRRRRRASPASGSTTSCAVSVNTSDSGNVGLEGTETATLIAEGTGTIGGSDAFTGTALVTGLNAGEHLDRPHRRAPRMRRRRRPDRQHPERHQGRPASSSRKRTRSRVGNQSDPVQEGRGRRAARA